MHSNNRHAVLGAALERRAEEAEAARQRLIQMAETGEPTPPAETEPVHWSKATCPRPFNHTGDCWPLGGTHPAT